MWKRVKNLKVLLQDIEKEFDVEMGEDGARRFAFIFPENLRSNYKKKIKSHGAKVLSSKRIYATELIAEILHKELS